MNAAQELAALLHRPHLGHRAQGASAPDFYNPKKTMKENLIKSYPLHYRNNHVTDIGRDPDAYIVNNEHKKKCPLRYAMIDNEYFWGILWLIQNRHANAHVQDEHGYDPIDWCHEF